jgi:hypothetical protein
MAGYQTYEARADAQRAAALAATTSPFTIEVRFLGGLTDRQQAAFTAAADRWTKMIVGDLPTATVDNEAIDDVLILAQGSDIDGPGRILGQAGPTDLRPESAGPAAFTPAKGVMSFDTADLAWFAHVPGLKVVMPATPADAKGLLLAAVDDPNPVIMLEHKLLYRQSGPVPAGAERTPLGVAAVRRRGADLTIVATGVMVSRALAAADQLATEGIAATVLDPRTLTPLDTATVLAEVAATGRALLVQEAPRTAGFMAEVAALVAESWAFAHLRAPVRRLCGLDVPIPYAPALEQAAVPQVPDIVAAATELVAQW